MASEKITAIIDEIKGLSILEMCIRDRSYAGLKL